MFDVRRSSVFFAIKTADSAALNLEPLNSEPLNLLIHYSSFYQEVDESYRIPGGLGADMVVEKNGAAACLPGHFCDVGIRPAAQFIISIVIVKLLLHVTGAPTLGVAPVKADIEKPGIGDNIESRKQSR